MTPATPVALPATVFKLSDQSLTQIALQVAMDIAPIQEIARQVGITEAYYDATIKINPFFQKVLQQYTIEWNSVKNTPERVKWKAQALTEMVLPTLGARMLDAHEALPAVTEAAKLVSRLGGVDQDKAGPAQGEKFTITINLGPDEAIVFEKSGPPQKTIEGFAVPALSEGNGNDLSLQPLSNESPNDPPLRIEPQGDGTDAT